MYLKSLKIKNFRLIKNTIVKFNKGLNIIIGPNNSGKTAIIDALYYCFHFKDYSNKKININDFHVDEDYDGILDDIEFFLSFVIEDDFETAVFLDLYNPKNHSLDLYFKWHYNGKLEKIQSYCYGGANNDNPITREIFDYILNIYLGPLRDAERYLTSGKPNIISKLFSKVTSEEDKKIFMDDLNDKIRNSQLSDFINDYTENSVQNYLNEMIFKEDCMNLSMIPMEYDFDKFTQYWNIKIPFSSNLNKLYMELSQNGLGYNNLIYISVLLSYLEVIKEDNEEGVYISLIIEEPEAHLHPQLQKLFLSYMSNLNQNNNIQFFITTHSPTLTSKTDLKNLILIQDVDNINKNNFNVVCSNLRKIFPKENINFLKKFLDVTKSQLLFTKNIIFVEGVTEAILVPLFAQMYDFDLDKNGVELVNVNGLPFKHFLPLFKKQNNLNFKGVILTDKDEKEFGGLPSNSTYKKIKNFNEDYRLKICGANKTFEYDLIITNNFNSLIWDVFVDQHPNIFNIEKNQHSLFEIFNDDNNIKKTEIALKLFEKLKNCENSIIIPKYIKEGFDFLKED